MRKLDALIAVTLVGTAMTSMAACSDNGSAVERPLSSSSNPTGVTPSASGQAAPAMPVPLDTSKFAAAPCTSLTESQTSGLGIAQQGQQSRLTSGDQSCTWEFGPNLEWKVQLAYVVPDAHNGLQNEYDLHASGFYSGGYFEPTTVNGYPGVYSSVSDNRSQGLCALAVGINSETLATVQIVGQAGKDNCKAAASVETRVIDTVKTGGQ